MRNNVVRFRRRKQKHRTWTNAHHRGQQQRKRAEDRRWLLMAGALVMVAFLGALIWPSGNVGLTGQTPTSMAAVGPSGFSCRVMSITDGDTLRCWDGTRVRLHAVAAREKDESCSPGHPCPAASGASATAKLSELTSGQTLQCEQTGTSYNRITAICRNEADVEINCAMVESGTTLIWPKFNAERAICRRG